jgi:hypothetical protein
MRLVSFYSLADPEFPADIRYVGQTSRLRDRKAWHSSAGYRADGNSAMWRWLLGLRGRVPVMSILETVEIANWSRYCPEVVERENMWIERHSSHPLLNYQRSRFPAKYFAMWRDLWLVGREPFPSCIVSGIVAAEANDVASWNLLRLSRIILRTTP